MYFIPDPYEVFLTLKKSESDMVIGRRGRFKTEPSTFGTKGSFEGKSGFISFSSIILSETL
jgi:hypothetical protein